MKWWIACIALAVLFMFLLSRLGHAESGMASWYGPRHHGRLTANGERFNQHAMTAAHKSLPFGTRVMVCSASRCTQVRINDRGPFVRGRIIDLSTAAAGALGIKGQGVARVTVSRAR